MSQFNSFVIFAGMRTGSNLLEATLNINGLKCLGEAYNPFLVGWPDCDKLFGMSLAQREADPMELYKRIVASRGERLIRGFRYFHDHDPRMFDPIMDDPTCAKVVLTRNPVDSWVSTRLAYASDKWKLNSTEVPPTAKVDFDAASFRETLDANQAFFERIYRALHIRAQTAFWLNYDDLRDEDVLTGLVHWLGRTDRPRASLTKELVPQNPREMAEKVNNIEEMKAELVAVDPFQLHRIPAYEAKRGPAVPSFQICEAGQGLLFMPVRGGPTAQVNRWLRGLGEVREELTRNELRQWKRSHEGHRSFTVVRHPLLRAWDAFGDMLGTKKPDLREALRMIHRVSLPPEDELEALTEDQLVPLFVEWLGFLQRNVNGQTGIVPQPRWATQAETLAGFSQFGSPDLVVRETRLAEDLGYLAHSVGIDAKGPKPSPVPDILDDQALRKAAKAAYLRDYIAFGFSGRP